MKLSTIGFTVLLTVSLATVAEANDFQPTSAEKATAGGSIVLATVAPILIPFAAANIAKANGYKHLGIKTHFKK